MSRQNIDNSALYKPMSHLVVRAPTLPINVFEQFNAHTSLSEYVLEETNEWIQRAIAVASLSLSDELVQMHTSERRMQRRESSILRYLIRMSTRPTPFGLFAGVGLSRWGNNTSLHLEHTSPRIRIRPDMGWLMRIVWQIEADIKKLAHLQLTANPAIYVHHGRIYLDEQAPHDLATPPSPISIRASKLALAALEFTHEPIRFMLLHEHLTQLLPTASRENINSFIYALVQKTILMTDLRPSLTGISPFEYILAKLAEIPQAHPIYEALVILWSSLETWEKSSGKDSILLYRNLVHQAQSLSSIANQQDISEQPLTSTEEHSKETVISEPAETYFQVDMALPFHGALCYNVANDCAEAAKLLLQFSSLPHGYHYLAEYRQMFIDRYGYDRQIPLLEVLDSNRGLGLPAFYRDPTKFTLPPINNNREGILTTLLLNATKNQSRVMELDNNVLESFALPALEHEKLPDSLDLAVFIAASSCKAIDSGEYCLIVSPGLGAENAGRYLGRFAYLFSEQAPFGEREGQISDSNLLIQAEINYLPHRSRAANVMIRPAAKTYEIPYGTSPGVRPEQVIPINELTLSIRDDRFVIWWQREAKEVRLFSGHMLLSTSAPGVIRFLADVGSDTICQLTPFSWGRLEVSPFLPRVQRGRIILRPAQWKLNSVKFQQILPHNSSSSQFIEKFKVWRDEWNVPRYVYLSDSDRRLLLDLDSPAHIEEIRRELLQSVGSRLVFLEEGIPGPDDSWLQGPGGSYFSEIVVSLALQEGHNDIKGSTQRTQQSQVTIYHADRFKPISSDWIYVKIYCGASLQEELLINHIKRFVNNVLASQLAFQWFFIRYTDPEPHIRLRFQGQPEILMNTLLPKLSEWLASLMANGDCLKFVYDVYEREIERYGGPNGIIDAEQIFCSDSTACLEIMSLLYGQAIDIDAITINVILIDRLLQICGMDRASRVHWAKSIIQQKSDDGAIYRRRGPALRQFLGNPEKLRALTNGEHLFKIIAQRDQAMINSLQSMRQHQLDKPISEILKNVLHMQTNRLLGINRLAEHETLILLHTVNQGLVHAPL